VQSVPIGQAACIADRRRPGFLCACLRACLDQVQEHGSVKNATNPVISTRRTLAFTIAPHLQIINYPGRFSRFVGI
jgi:hypothetical protein